MTKTKARSTFKPLPTNLVIRATPTRGGKAEIDVLSVEGTDISEYVVAVEQEKAAADLKSELRPALLKVGVPHIITTNCAAETDQGRIKSVKVMDDNGSVVRITFKSAYRNVDKYTMLEAFEAINAKRLAKRRATADPGKYAAEILHAAFDSTVFLDAKGNFDPPKYDKYREAIEKVAVSFEQPCPLTTAAVTEVKETFHERRWVDFNAEENMVLSTVFPNTVDCVAVENMHTSAHVLEQLAAKIDDNTVNDADFRAQIRALLAQKSAVLALDMKRT